MVLDVRHTWTIYLTNVDPKTNAVVLIPIAAMVMVIAVLMIVVVIVPVTIPALIVSIIRKRLGGPSRQ